MHNGCRTFGKNKPLLLEKPFLMGKKALKAFMSLKNELTSGTLQIIDENVHFAMETDASNNATCALLNQRNQSVTFFFRMLNKNERHHSSVEKETTAIVEAIYKWTEFLCGRHVILITYQQAVAFMYSAKNHSKIKNNKILQSRTKLSEYDFDIICRSGKINCVPHVLFRAFCADIYDNLFREMHQSLCHSGAIRLHHFVGVKKLLYFVNEVRNVVAKCKVCSKFRPNLVNHQLCM